MSLLPPDKRSELEIAAIQVDNPKFFRTTEYFNKIQNKV
jgi:hypothetical protein